LVQTTPEWVYLSTGVRAIDHAVEELSSLKATDVTDKSASKALPLLVDSLLRVKRDPTNVRARTDSQLGARHAARPYVEDFLALGASHAIGHILGSVCGVPHGHTSCVMLPSVLRYNFSVNKEKQEKIKQLLLSVESVRNILKSQDTGSLQAADILQAIFKELGMPTTLREVKVEESKFQEIAEKTVLDMWAPTNPIPITSPEQVVAILKTAY